MVGLVFVVFGERDYGNVKVAGVEYSEYGIELRFSTIDKNQIGQRPFVVVEASLKHFAELCSVADGRVVEIKEAILCPIGYAVGEHHHGACGVATLDVGDIVPFDAMGGSR